MKLKKDLPRLLVICRDDVVRSELVMLLSGYGYYVDYEDNVKDGLKRFIQTKHMIVILDKKALPKDEKNLMSRFTVYQRNPIILVAAQHGDEKDMVRYLKSGVYDLIHLPLEVERLDFVLQRLVDHSSLNFKYEFLKILVVIAGMTIPLLILFAAFLMGK